MAPFFFLTHFLSRTGTASFENDTFLGAFSSRLPAPSSLENAVFPDAFSSREPGPASLENATRKRRWQNRVDAWAAAFRLQIRREQKIVHVRIVLRAILE
jgi:hypothetical protein